MPSLSTIRAWLRPPYFRRTSRLFSVENKHRDQELLNMIRVASDGKGTVCCPFCCVEMYQPWFPRKKKGTVAGCPKCFTKFHIRAGYVDIL